MSTVNCSDGDDRDNDGNARVSGALEETEDAGFKDEISGRAARHWCRR